MIKLIQGDCLEVMKEIPDKSVDLVLTDPPYGMSFKSNYREEKYKEIINDSDLSWLDYFVNEIYRVTKENTAHYVFCSFHNIDLFKQALEKKFTIKNLLVWEKNNTGMGDLTADFASKTEFIWFIQKGRREIIGSRDPNIFTARKTGNNFHPTEKPIDLMEYLLSKFSNSEDTILDPFMGAGSTGIACKLSKRKFIGIELDQDYFKIAQDRINNTQSQLF